MRSAYHTRKYDIHRLSQLTPRPGSAAGSSVVEGEDKETEKVDIFLSHDWPVGIARFGDEKGLLRRKTFFTEEVSFLSSWGMRRSILTESLSCYTSPYPAGPDGYARIASPSSAPSDVTPVLLVLRPSSRQVLRRHPPRQVTRAREDHAQRSTA